MAERDLGVLLKSLTVTRRDEVWTYKFHKAGGLGGDLLNWIKHRAFGSRARILIEEEEGVTEITLADFRTPDDNRWVWLELDVNSDLQAVGFLAAVSTALAQAGVPCNAFAGLRHDHVLVPEAKADAAIMALRRLSDAS